LRLVTWNCYRGECRRRSVALDGLAPDIVILQECGAPKAPQDDKCVWFGNSSIQGVSVLTRGDWAVRPGDLDPHVTDSAYPFRVSGALDFNVLGVWTQRNPTHARALNNALDHYHHFLLERPSIVVGDFNDHPRWDSKDSRVNYSTLAARLQSEFGLVSAFHAHRPGVEEPATLYWQWREDQPYHIDYCFVPEQWAPHITQVQIGSYDEWAAAKSDHRPLLVEINESSAPS